MAKWDYDCAVIGGGIGGMVSALYLGRFKRKTAVFLHDRARVTYAPHIRNLLGHTSGIRGIDLLARLQAQVTKYESVEFIKAQASVRKIKNGFAIETAQGKTYLARKVIVATGIKDREPSLKNLKALRSAGYLRYCSICDGYEIKGRPILVFADDDFGLQKALFLSCWTNQIYICTPQDFHPAPIRLKEMKEIGAVFVPCEDVTVRAMPNKRGLNVTVNREESFYCYRAYVELGCRVNNYAFQHLRNLRRVKEGFITVTSEQRTSVPGLFAVGDCVNQVGQVSIASGQAAVAAVTIHNDLSGLKS